MNKLKKDIYIIGLNYINNFLDMLINSNQVEPVLCVVILTIDCVNTDIFESTRCKIVLLTFSIQNYQFPGLNLNKFGWSIWIHSEPNIVNTR